MIRKNSLVSYFNAVAAVFLSFAIFPTSFAKTFEPSTAHADLHSKIEALSLPLYFGIPKSATSSTRISDEYDTPDLLLNYKHPDSKNASNPVGLRFYIAKRSPETARNLVQSNFVKSGDVVISFRPDWAKSGPYTQAQMGQTHAALVYVDEHKLLKNIEQPLEPKFLFPDVPNPAADPNNPIGDDSLAYLNAENLAPDNVHKTQPMVHIFRPRFMDADRTKNFNAWAKLLREQTSANPEIRNTDPTRSIYNKLILFNIDYMDPKYSRGDNVYSWVKQFGQIILKKAGVERLAMYCSELVWTMLSLSGCHPETDRNQILGAAPATCIKPAFKPLPMVGDLFVNEREDANKREAGMGDGPLLVVDSQKFESTRVRDNILASVFNDATAQGNLSRGQQSIVRQVTPSFMELKQYYANVYTPNSQTAKDLRTRFNMQSGQNGFLQPDPRNRLDETPVLSIHYKDNYSPTSFGINSYLPDENENRQFDYVGTIAYDDVL
jgi:hypothetical protein